MAAAPALLETLQRHRDEDVVVAAAHALVSMQAPEAEGAVETLAGSDSPCLRRLAELLGPFRPRLDGVT
jgi:hypothetical protein